MSRAPDEVLDHPKTPVRELLEVAHGLAGVDLSTVLPLNVSKPERLVSAPPDQPTTATRPPAYRAETRPPRCVK